LAADDDLAFVSFTAYPPERNPVEELIAVIDATLA
jgi:hypothetical protein